MNDSEDRPLLYDHFKRSADALWAQYQKSKSQFSSANIGTNREDILRKGFLSNVLPPRLVARNGEVWDAYGNRTGQFEIIVLRDDAASLGIGDADAFLAEGVFAVIEVKSNLNRLRLREALKGLKKVSELKTAHSTNRILSSLLTLSAPLLCVFAYEGATLETLENELQTAGDQCRVDLICVLNRGALIAKSRLVPWKGGEQYQPCPGRAAALAWLYYHLVSYSADFITRDFALEPYFEPLNGWADPRPGK
jgi:hypothetical protein